ncbi:segregation/condensation protein A [Actinopolymorpha sp. B9G3]|uniref:segregation and condensation protein A n=1 Tax=Actinopolymorpha sp. B9G3 TaxID=3158970 RepID=UPI0032D975CF
MTATTEVTDSDTGGAAGDPEFVRAERRAQSFTVRLDNFEGPFDLLLGLISKHKLDVTEIALSVVTDEFIGYIRAMGPQWDLDQTTEFLLVASTLLDLKAARLLPQGEVEDEEDLALLEARDLLFARLLQYRAYKQVAGIMATRMAAEARRFPRAVGLEDRFGQLLPEVLIGLGVEEFARLAANALRPRAEPVLSLAHIHAPRVSVREQATVMIERLRRTRSTTFRALTADSPNLVTTIARFLALLELFREGAVAFEQAEALAELTVRWSGSDEGDIAVGDEFDEGDQAGLRPVQDTGQAPAESAEEAPGDEAVEAEPAREPVAEGAAGEGAAGEGPTERQPTGEHAGQEQDERESGE